MKFSDLIMDRFLEFAMEGHISNPNWKPFNQDNRNYNVIEFNIPQELQVN
jgi:hypothetical protein